MTEQSFLDYFSTNSDGYAAYRPSYPPTLVQELTALCPARDRALDCACGSGQLSVLLAGEFAEVIATDASDSQIQNAHPAERVTYRVALAEESGLPDSSVDLVTVAQAAHWLHLERFYTEVRRVARPGAILALISYGVFQMEGAVNDCVQHFYRGALDPYWPPERVLVEEGYRTLSFPFPKISLPAQVICVDWDLPALQGYIRTWSATRALVQAQGPAELMSFEEELTHLWGDPKVKRRIVWPLALRVGRV